MDGLVVGVMDGLVLGCEEGLRDGELGGLDDGDMDGLAVVRVLGDNEGEAGVCSSHGKQEPG